MSDNGGGGKGRVNNQLIFLKRKTECSEMEKYVFCEKMLRNIFGLIWACLLYKDLCKLKSSTEENTQLRIVGSVYFFIKILRFRPAFRIF